MEDSGILLSFPDKQIVMGKNHYLEWAKLYFILLVANYHNLK